MEAGNIIEGNIIIVKNHVRPVQDFFIYTPNNDELKPTNLICLFDPDAYHMAAMNPPFAYENKVLEHQQVDN